MDEDQLPDADLWEKKRSEGMSGEQATAYVRGRRKPALPGGVNTFVQGATLGFGDELTAGLRALPRALPGGESFGDAYSESVGAERRGVQQFRDAHPVLAPVTEIGGVIASNIPVVRAAGLLGKGAAGVRAAPRLLRGIGFGAAEGAVAAAGAAEGGLDKRLPAAATGGTVGAAFGVAGPVAGRIGGAALDVARLRGPMSRFTAGIIESPADRGRRALLGAVERSGKTLDDAEYALTPSQTGDHPTTLMDVLGDEGQAMAMYAGNRPGPGRNVVQGRLRGRGQDQSQRVAGALAEETGLGRPNAFRAIEEIEAERKALAAPLYAKIENVSIKDPDGNITAVLELPAFRAAYERAARIVGAEGGRVPEIYNEAGQVIRGTDAPAIPVRVFDLVKRGLDDVIETGMDGNKRIGRAEARALRGRLRETLAQVDELVPEYGQARAVYAGQSALRDAVELGDDMFRGTGSAPEEIASVLKTMSESEREFFRKGALSQLLGRMEGGRDTWNAVPRLVGSGRQRQQLRTLFPDEASFDRFMGRADLEGTGERLAGPVISGSRTEPMRLAGRDFETSGAAALEEATSRGPAQALIGGLRRALFQENEGVQRVVGQAAGTAGELLTRGATGGPTARSAVQELRDFQGRMGQRRLAGLTAMGTTGATAGMVAGGAMGATAGAASQRQDEESMSPADLWELKVSQGFSPAQATLYVEQQRNGPIGRPR